LLSVIPVKEPTGNGITLG